MVTDDIGDPDQLTDREREAVHEVELGIERLHRAHGHLVAFHHNTGRAIDHLAVAEESLRNCGYPELADRLRDEYLPRGVLDSDTVDGSTGRWSYALLESFQTKFLPDFVGFGDDVRETVADGLSHPFERKREREWKSHARRG